MAYINTSTGNHTVATGDIASTVSVGGGTNTVTTGAGNDTVRVGSTGNGAAGLQTRNSNSTISTGGGTDAITLSTGLSVDTVNAGGGIGNTIGNLGSANSADTVIHDAVGGTTQGTVVGTGVVTVTASQLGYTSVGTAGVSFVDASTSTANVTLNGGTGVDTLTGGTADDTIAGLGGADNLFHLRW